MRSPSSKMRSLASAFSSASSCSSFTASGPDLLAESISQNNNSSAINRPAITNKRSCPTCPTVETTSRSRFKKFTTRDFLARFAGNLIGTAVNFRFSHHSYETRYRSTPRARSIASPTARRRCSSVFPYRRVRIPLARRLFKSSITATRSFPLLTDVVTARSRREIASATVFRRLQVETFTLSGADLQSRPLASRFITAKYACPQDASTIVESKQ